MKHILGAKEHRGKAKYCNVMINLKKKAYEFKEPKELSNVKLWDKFLKCLRSWLFMT